MAWNPCFVLLHMYIYSLHFQETQSQCQPPNCYCVLGNECYYSDYTIKPDFNKLHIPHGSHDFDYTLVITAINKAQLQTVTKYKVGGVKTLRCVRFVPVSNDSYSLQFTLHRLHFTPPECPKR